MKKADWFIASLFILFGLSCLIMSMTFIEHSESVHTIMLSAVQYILWIGLPLMIVGFVYMWMKNRFKKKKK